LEGTTTIVFNPFDWLLLVPLVFIGGDGAAGRSCSLLIVRPRGIPTDRLITFVDNPHLLFFRPRLLPLFLSHLFCFRIFILLLPIVSGQATAAAAPFARQLLLFRPVRDL
jgi:hypothetical protein